MIKYYKKTFKDKVLLAGNEFKPGCLTYASDPEPEELSELSERFSLDHDMLSDALDPYEAPRIEVKKEATYVFTRVPEQKSVSGQFSTYPLLLVIGPDFLLALTEGEPNFILKALKREGVYTSQHIKLFLNIFSEIEGIFSELLSKINKKINFFRLNMEKIRDNDIVSFISFEISLNEFLSALMPARQILDTILSGRTFGLHDKDKDLLEDIRLSNEQLIERSKSSLVGLVNVRQAYEVLSSNRLNRAMRLLTTITVALALPTMITSFYGMNVKLPFSENTHTFWFIIASAVVLLLALFMAFKKRRLL